MNGPVSGILVLLSLSASCRAEHGPSLFSQRQETGNTELDYVAKWMQMARVIESNPSLKHQWQERVKAIDERDVEYAFPPFECDVVTSPSVPTSVHELRPSDIQVVAALGDSITAGNGLGARHVLEVLYQNRGESWSVGGDKDLDDKVITITNLIRKFNPGVNGYSICRGGENNYIQSWLNRAVPGARSDDMKKQADDLIERARNDSRIDFDNDWKMVTLFVGGNDLCASCRNSNFEPEPYRAYIEEGLDALHEGLPRTFVNLVPMFDVTPVHNMTTGTLCDLLHWGFCDCVMNETTRPELKPRQMGYYNELEALVSSGKYDSKTDFTVVLQPMFRDSLPPIDPDTGGYDLSILSYDCFHPSRVSHQGFAYMMWQTLFIPVGQKPFEIGYDEMEEPYACPTEEHPYLFTRVNSAGTKLGKKSSRRRVASRWSKKLKRKNLARHNQQKRR